MGRKYTLRPRISLRNVVVSVGKMESRRRSQIDSLTRRCGSQEGTELRMAHINLYSIFEHSAVDLDLYIDAQNLRMRISPCFSPTVEQYLLEGFMG